MALKKISAYRAPRRKASDHQTGIASRVLVERPLSISHEGWLRLPLKLPPQRQPGFPDAPGTLPRSIKFLPDVFPTPRRGGELSRNFRILGRFESHGIAWFSPRQGDAAKAIAYTCAENFEGEEKP